MRVVGKSQEQIWQDPQNEMFANSRLAFPSDCRVSRECQDFIVKCLARDPQSRPDIHQLSSHGFLKSRMTLY